MNSPMSLELSYNSQNPPPLADPRQNLLSQCCCCCDLRTGVLVLAAIDIFASILNAIPGSPVSGSFATLFAVQIIFSLLRLFFAIAGFYGALHYRTKWVRPYAVWSIVALGVAVIGFVVTGATLNGLADDACSVLDSESERNACVSQIQLSYWSAAIITFLVSFYFTYAVYSFWKQLVDTYANLAAGAVPAGHMAQPNVVVVHNPQYANPPVVASTQPPPTYSVN